MQDVTRQFCVDLFDVAMHLELGVGYKRCMRVHRRFIELFNKYYDMLDYRNNEADFLRVMLDRALEDIIKDNAELVPFEKRYPNLKPCDYTKPARLPKKKKWR